MAHFNQKISAVGFAIALGLGLVACSGDNSEVFPPTEQQPAAGSAGTAGGSSVQPPASGGSGGSAGETFNPPDGGKGGSTSTGGSSNVGGSSNTGGSVSTGGSSNTAGTGGSSNTGGTSNVGGSGGTTSTGGSSNTGGTGGTETVPPDAGTSGAGGTTSTGGSGGSVATGGSGGTTSTGGSTNTGGSTSTGGSGGTTGAGELELTIVPATTGQHTIKAFVQTLTFMPGEPDWGTEHSASGTRLTFKVTAYAGSEFVFNGYYDPEAGKDVWIKSFCDKTSMKPTVAIMAKFNGQPIGAPNVIDNGSNGCNLTFKAIPLVQDYMDADGDGESYGQGHDCDDSDAFVHHGAIETPDDQVDYDCDGSINPLHVNYRLTIGQTSYVPTFYDWSHGGKSYPMTWNSGGFYEVAIEKPIAAREFVIQYSPTKWSVGMVNGGCVKTADVTAFLEQSNTSYTVDMVAYSQYNTCHSVLTNFQP